MLKQVQHDKRVMKEEIIKKYLPLVKSIANKYKTYGVPVEDLIQEGCIGILEASEKFDATKGTKFSTYAFYWIKKNILKAIEEANKQSLNLECNNDVVACKITAGIPPKRSMADVGAYNYTSLQIDSENQSEIALLLLGMTTFPEIERKVLTLVFGLDGKEACNLNEISKILHLPKERVRQIREKAKRRLGVASRRLP